LPRRPQLVALADATPADAPIIGLVALAALRVAVQNAIDVDRVDELNDAVDRAFAYAAAGLPAPRSPR